MYRRIRYIRVIAARETICNAYNFTSFCFYKPCLTTLYSLSDPARCMLYNDVSGAWFRAAGATKSQNQRAQNEKMKNNFRMTPWELQVGRRATTARAISHSSEWTTVSSAVAFGFARAHDCTMKVAPSWSHPSGKKGKKEISPAECLAQKIDIFWSRFTCHS